MRREKTAKKHTANLKTRTLIFRYIQAKLSQTTKTKMEDSDQQMLSLSNQTTPEKQDRTAK